MRTCSVHVPTAGTVNARTCTVSRTESGSNQLAEEPDEGAASIGRDRQVERVELLTRACGHRVTWLICLFPRAWSAARFPPPPATERMGWHSLCPAASSPLSSGTRRSNAARKTTWSLWATHIGRSSALRPPFAPRPPASRKPACMASRGLPCWSLKYRVSYMARFSSMSRSSRFGSPGRGVSRQLLEDVLCRAK